MTVDLDAAHELLTTVRTQLARIPDDRLRQLLDRLVVHLHNFATEVELGREEWLAALQFLNAVGQKSTPDRDEFMLMSDVLGLSSLLDVLHQPPAATEGTVLGPFYAPDSPPRVQGASLIDNDDGGQRVRVSGTVSSTSGVPLAGASVEVWSCATNGLYPAQDPTQDPGNLRALLKTDAAGAYEFQTLRPSNYSVPLDGPVGRMLAATGGSTIRAAHVHFRVSAPGHATVVTHLFDADSTYLRSDAVFSVRDSLIREFPAGDEQACSVRFDITLAPSGRKIGNR